jgi:hypothetical protein
MGSSSLELSGFDAAKAAKASASLGYSAPVDTERAGNTIWCTWGIDRKSVRGTAMIMDSLDFRPDFLKMPPDTISAEADHLRDGLGSLAAVLTCTHGYVCSYQS